MMEAIKRWYGKKDKRVIAEDARRLGINLIQVGFMALIGNVVLEIWWPSSPRYMPLAVTGFVIVVAGAIIWLGCWPSEED